MRKYSLVALLSISFCGIARADFLYLKDGNIIECKIIGKVIRPSSQIRGKDVPNVEVENEKGEKQYFEIAELDTAEPHPLGFIKGQTSWERKAENAKWYENEAPKRPHTWDKQAEFARQCREKELFDEAMTHFKEAYDLRAALPLEKTETEETRHRRLAEFLEKDCGMFDEAVTENQKVYATIKDTAKTSQQHSGMADWCAKHYLYGEAEAEFQAAVAAEPGNKIIARAYDQFKVSRAVPIDREMYNILKPHLELACKYLKNNEFINSDGSMGKDAEEAGVQSLRGMTAMTAEALLAEWDLKYLEDPVAAGTPPKQVTNAINFLLTGKKGSGHFLGDDLWGPNLALQFFVRCASRPYLADRHADVMKGIETAIEDLKKLQRPDGGWNYYGAPVVRDNTSCSFLSAAILVNLVAAKNLGATVDSSMISRAKDFVADLKFGEGTYLYSKETEKEKGTNRSFSAIGACARSPLCELSVIAAGGGSMESLKQTIRNFMTGHDWLKSLKGRAGTHVGKGRTAPYYYMFSHFWTARAIKQLPRQFVHQFQIYMGNQIILSREPDGTFKDFTGTKAYKLYATALGVLAMHELISKEPDVAFSTVKAPKLPDFVTTVSTSDVSPSDQPKK